ncbi:MAG: DUF2059 domain-containing protein [Desulfobacterales bacterium]|uniref:DUF2059 domain-containing protein n=1 Tax=Candidatus Desulfatibia vada TaxID=2841696 RepID=A0A8J6NXK0_9BACT|nr:DUF2059 domain-containing protein [Candidatus Desulfatibia vada]
MTRELSNSMKIVFLSLLIILPLYSYSMAETANEEKEFFHKFFRVAGVESQYNQKLNAMARQFHQGFASGLKRQVGQVAVTNPAEKDMVMQLVKQTVGQYIKRMNAALVKEMPFKALVDHVYYPVYSKYFNVSELKEVIAFYESPAGRKFVSGTPALMQKTALIFNQKYVPKLQGLSKKIADEEWAKIKPQLDKLGKKGK